MVSVVRDGGEGKVMPDLETLERFIARVEENAHAEACEEFYTENSSMQENNAPPRIGRAAHVASERAIFSRVKSVTSRCVRPIFVNGDKVVIRWIFRFQWPDNSVTQIEELAYQRWEGDRIAEEQFFFDPAQRKPRADETTKGST
jgi:SnoaL-like domain